MPTPCAAPSPNQYAKRPSTGAWFGGCQPAIVDIAQRNVNAAFDLAKNLAGAENLAEIMQLQGAYWQKLYGNLTSQAEEVRALSKT